MLKNKFISDISISTVQAILNQFSGIVVFFIISKYLDKSNFGHISWALAVLTLVFSVLGFGLEQLAVKKTAMGTDPGSLLQSYLFHVIFTGVGFIGLVLLLQTEIPVLKQDGYLFILLSVSQCLSFFASPFRQIANGLQKFSAFFVMSSTANVIKASCLLILALMGKVSLPVIIYIYLLASSAELIMCVWVYKIKLCLPTVPGYNFQQYIAFIKEALPQLGITICNTALQRMDWILLGLLSTAVMLAEYSFTNKIFELAIMPLLIVAPVLFPWIVKIFNNEVNKGKIGQLRFFIKVEIIGAVLIALLVNICWKDVIDSLTSGKYGASTTGIIFVLSFAMPLAYINNFFWSVNFAKGNMRTIFSCILVSSLVNIAADFLLIPLFSAIGAAVGFVLASLVQMFYYSKKTYLWNNKQFFSQLLLVCVNGLIAGFLSKYLFTHTLLQAIFSVAVYSVLLLLTGQLHIKDLGILKQIMAV
jgi:O-antigen/teichoic acid export membrane protein